MAFNFFMHPKMSQRRLLSLVAHGSGFFSFLLLFLTIPTIIAFTSNDEITKENARESLNFQITVIILILLLFSLIALFFRMFWLENVTSISIIMAIVGVPLMIALIGIITIMDLIMPLIAIMEILNNPYRVYRYSFILRIL